MRRLALVCCLCLVAPARAQSTPAWVAEVDPQRVSLTYVAPHDATFKLEIICDRKSGAVTATPNVGVRGLPKGAPATVTLTGPGGRAVLQGEATFTRDDFTMVTGKAPSAHDLVAALSPPGTLTVDAHGEVIRLPLGPQAAKALADFRGACPSAAKKQRT